MDPVVEGSIEAVVLQAATNNIGTITDARLRMFLKDSLPFQFPWK
jgi:hypothetical protein